jgi:apolipoprotein N-acyltransferase
MGHEGILLAKFAAKKTVTPYVRFGDWFAYLAVVAVIIRLATNAKFKMQNAK